MMVNKPKMQGTAFESFLVTSLNLATHPWGRARRIAEGGANDEGDITYIDGFNQTWVIEAKATQTLNVTRVLGKAREKGGTYTVLAWKRLTRSKGNSKRTPDGEPIVVVVPWAIWCELMRRENL
jgi:hypothetical protein